MEHQRNKPKVIRPEIPADALAAFDRQAYADEFTFTPLEACDDFFKYRELSPLRNVGGPPHALIPSVKEYISLLKCIWLVYKLQKHFDTYAVYPESHWLSFVKALEDVSLSFLILICYKVFGTCVLTSEFIRNSTLAVLELVTVSRPR